MEEFAVLTFENTGSAIKAEIMLKESGETVRILPVPSEITAGCGFCIKLEIPRIQNIIEALDRSGVQYGHFYKITKVGLKKQIENIII